MRVLIATATAGAGHLAAAAALEEAWRALRPTDTVEVLDVVKLFSPLHRKLHADGYVKLVQHAPELWGLVFGKTDQPKVARRLNQLKRALPSASRLRLRHFIQRFKPDAVLCTHYSLLELLSGMQDEQRSSEASTPRRKLPFVVSIITDFEAHALWMADCVDLYCVATESTKARLVARGANAQNLVATGIPIAAKFALHPEPRLIRKRMGLRDDLPTLLVLSGGFGMGPVEEIVRQLDKVEYPFQVVVVTGKNPELRRNLAIQDSRHPTHVLGHVANMHELISASDLIITKPGGLTTSEVLAMGKPLLIVNPIPGQEAANSDFLLEHGAATKVNRVEDVPYRVLKLLQGNELRGMARKAKQLGRPEAARSICAEVLSRFKGESEPSDRTGHRGSSPQ